jgi:hypothetical protein
MLSLYIHDNKSVLTLQSTIQFKYMKLHKKQIYVAYIDTHVPGLSYETCALPTKRLLNCCTRRTVIAVRKLWILNGPLQRGGGLAEILRPA